MGIQKNNVMRIRLARGYKSRQKFADLLGVSPQQMHNIEVKYTTITPQNQQKLCQILKCSLDDLYTEDLRLDNQLLNRDDCVELKYYRDVFAAAGRGCINDDEGFERLKFYTGLLIELGIKNYENICVLRAKGNSMSPTIEDSDFLLVDLTKKEIFNRKIYIINENGLLKVKRLTMQDPFADEIIVLSDNQNANEFPPYSITKEKADGVFICGQVIAYFRNLTLS